MTELDEVMNADRRKKAAELNSVIKLITCPTGKFGSRLNYSKKVRRRQGSFNSYFISMVKEITYEACADSLFW